jgi:hypothetical protein
MPYTYDFPPGTDRVEEDGTEASTRYPLPSASIHDPLSWSEKHKALPFWLGIWFVFWATLPTLAISAVYGPIIEE